MTSKALKWMEVGFSLRITVVVLSLVVYKTLKIQLNQLALSQTYDYCRH